MPITRARATALLNQREMALYDDSRVNVLRKLDVKALDSRIARARDARDRARDLVRRQKLASRDRTGSKRGASGAANQRSKDKAELLAEVLARFEDQRKQAARAARTASAAAARKAPAKRGAAAKPSATGRAGAAKKAKTTGKTAKTTAKKAARKTADGATAAGRKTAKTAAKSAAGTTRTTKRAASARKRTAAPAGEAAAPARKRVTRPRLTPEQALERTRELLEAKQARDREPKPWEAVAHGEGGAPQPGYQSDAAAGRAGQLHAAESRQPAIQGSNSTRDRLNQGRRDHRRAPGEE